MPSAGETPAQLLGDGDVGGLVARRRAAEHAHPLELGHGRSRGNRTSFVVPAGPAYVPAMATDGMKHRSSEVTEGFERAPARAMLRAIGMTDDDFGKAQVAVASSWNEVTPCNMPLDRLAKRAKDGVRAAGGFPIEFTTIAVSDGISMGHEGMRASLVSPRGDRRLGRDGDARRALDALVTFAGCDKSLPGHAHGRRPLNLPSVFLYGGTILPGHHKARRSTSSACSRPSAPTPPARSTTPSSTPSSAAPARRRAAAPACSPPTRWRRWPRPSGCRCPARPAPRPSTAAATTSRTPRARPSSRLLEAGIRPRQIMTKEAFENAIAVVMALGGSTNAVLHLLAIANEARVELELDDFNRVAPGCPHIADIKPHGKYHMTDLDRAAACRW